VFELDLFFGYGERVGNLWEFLQGKFERLGRRKLGGSVP
jgi:hypothetical protein